LHIPSAQVLDTLRGLHQPPAHLGLDKAGGDDIDANAVVAFLLGESEGERLHGGLSHVVGCAARSEVQRGVAGDHDDVAAGPLAHARQHELREIVGREGVRSQHSLQLGRVRVGDAQAAAGDAGVVDEDVDVAELPEDFRDHLLVLFPEVDGGPEGPGPATQAVDGGDRIPRGLRVAPVVHRHIGAVFGEGPRDRAADPPSPSRDQGNPSRQRHATPSLQLDPRESILARIICDPSQRVLAALARGDRWHADRPLARESFRVAPG
jgi:hypothetical protein